MNEFKIKINGNDYNVVINNAEENTIDVEVNGLSYSVEMEKPLRNKKIAAKPVVTRSVENTVSAPTVQVAKPAEVFTAGGTGGAVKSPLPGVILEVFVKVGDSVKAGQKILVLEAMKMENTINSDKEGKVIEIKVQKGDSVLEGADLVIIG
jgi:biotin carboxyl carrier protein